MQQTQMSISGITTNQLAALDELISKPDIQSELSGIDRLCHNLLKAQNDTSNPDHFELLLADALALLGFESEHLGGPGKPDVLATAFLGSDSYSVVIEAKTCSVGKTLGLGQVDYASIQEHREEHSADYALLIAPAFSTGKLVDRARNDKVGMMTTEFLVAIMRQHDLFPFSLVELRRLFECHGPVDGLEAEIERVHLQHINYLQLAGIVLQVFDEFQRQQDISEPISSHSIYYLLLGRAQQSQVALDRTQIDQVLALLSNPILDILAKKDEGYVLTLSPDAARQRLVALESLITEPDV